ncbi:hypothetical protein GCM10010306_001870 [Streptomyces umbrinus]|nr:hypothetical protein GCM10010306_001870 [Streptomyces umbrinus]
MAQDLLERCSRRRPEPGIPSPSGRGGFNRTWFSRTARDDDWWAAFTRGASDEHVLQALTAGLPIPVHSPAALVHNRLTTKLPPEPEPTPPPRAPLRVLECAKCGTPGRPKALPGGICGPCRGENVLARPSTPLTATAVHTHAADIRAAMANRREGIRT